MHKDLKLAKLISPNARYEDGKVMIADWRFMPHNNGRHRHLAKQALVKRGWKIEQNSNGQWRAMKDQYLATKDNLLTLLRILAEYEKV